MKKYFIVFFIMISLSSVSFNNISQYKEEYYEPLGLYNTSWYGPGFHGKTTANGERYDQYDLTAAHKTLPFNTILIIKCLKTNKIVEVRINDRGPYIRGRQLDLSYSAAKSLNLLSKGVAKFQVYKKVQ